MIIIKNQDKNGTNISEYNNIVLCEDSIFAILHPVHVIKKIATYPTEERAKEVMDMIEEHIRILYVDKAIMQHMSIESFSDPAYELINRITKECKKSAIFTMPKE